jgi:hypothetical protein
MIAKAMCQAFFYAVYLQETYSHKIPDIATMNSSFLQRETWVRFPELGRGKVTKVNTAEGWCYPRTKHKSHKFKMRHMLKKKKKRNS